MALKLPIRRDVLALTTPVFFEQLFVNLLGAVNTIMAARIGRDAVSAIGLSMASATHRMQALQGSVAEARQTAQEFSGELANSASSADQVCDLVSTIESGAQSMESSMRLVATAQRARADATSILHGQEVNVTSLSEMEREAARIARSRKWIKGSGDREALVAIYDRLFANIESQMR